MEPVFLELAEVLKIHSGLLKRYGGRPGILDLELLTSALAAPGAGLGEKYVHAGLWEMAAAYLYYMINLHPFVDGNRRVAATAAVVFLELNGFEMQTGEQELEHLVRETALGKADKAEVTEFFRRKTMRKV